MHTSRGAASSTVDTRVRLLFVVIGFLLTLDSTVCTVRARRDLSYRCPKRNNFKLSSEKSCRDIAFMRVGIEFNTGDYQDYKHWYINDVDLSGWKDLNCDMVRQKQTEKVKYWGDDLDKGGCAKTSKFVDGTRYSSGSPICFGTKRYGIKARGGVREDVVACPVEHACYEDNKHPNPISRVYVLEGDKWGVRSLRPECYNADMTNDKQVAHQTNWGFEWLSDLDLNTPHTECGPSGRFLGFIHKMQIRVSRDRKDGKGITDIRFFCSDPISRVVPPYIGIGDRRDDVEELPPKSCKNKNVAVGFFQYTREYLPNYKNNYDFDVGLLDVGMHCAPLQCPKYFNVKTDPNGISYCELNRCVCANGSPPDADCHDVDVEEKPAHEALHSTDTENHCHKSKLCPVDGKNRCSLCDFGYRLNPSTSRCELLTESRCPHGEKVSSCAAARQDAPFCLVSSAEGQVTGGETIDGVCALKTNQRCLVKNLGVACASCDEGFELVVTDSSSEVEMSSCRDIQECQAGGEGARECNEDGRRCFEMNGGYSCVLDCNPLSSYKVNDTSVPGGLEVCECRQNYYRDSPSVVDRVMGIDQEDFCVTCVNSRGDDDPLCTGHGQCVPATVPFARPTCACEPNYGGAGCEIPLTQIFVCNALLRFECVPDPSFVNDLELQPALLFEHAWRCATSATAQTTFAPADVSLRIERVSFTSVRLYDDDREVVSAEVFCALAHLHVQQMALDKARVVADPAQPFAQSYLRWAGAQVDTRVSWGAAQAVFDTLPTDGGLPNTTPLPLQKVSPDSSWWALETAGLCPFPFNTDIFRGEGKGNYIFAPCAPPESESELRGWFFVAQAVPGEPASTVGCFLLDASARGKDLSVVTDLQYRCAGYVLDAAGGAHSVLDCLVRSPVPPSLLANATTPAQRGLWIKDQCV